MVELFQRHLPRMRKVGINTTGLTPHRAIPMLTRIVKFCAETGLLLSVRVSLDGIGDIHNQVRQVKRGCDKAVRTIEAMQALAKEYPNFQFGIAATIFAMNLQDAENILAWARTRGLDVVFNMLRFTDAMLHIKDLVCPTCLSPCQVNVGAMKQFVPYAKFLKRAYQVKRDPGRHVETLPVAEQVR